MKILFLYNNPVAESLRDWLIEQGNIVICSQNKLEKDYVESEEFDLIISYTYRYIVSEDVIQCVNGNAVNLHISYLPYNKGANPNQWSFLENTPKGVTIHYMDATLDTGDIIAQSLVSFDEKETLYTTYNTLNQKMIELFKEIYAEYEFWDGMRKKPIGKGTYHTVKDYQQYADKLSNVREIEVGSISEFIKGEL